MSEELHDEVTSINAIYGDKTLVKDSDAGEYYALTFSSQPSISLRVEFPTNYPDAPLSVLGTQAVGEDVAKGDSKNLVDLTRDVLADVYIPGAACVFELIEEVNARLQQLGLDRSTKAEAEQDAQAHGQLASDDGSHQSSDTAQPLSDLGEDPPWVVSEVVSEKKSVFIARAASVSSVDQAKQYLAHLLLTDKKVAKATHNISAWRIRGQSGVQYQDCDGDGETAAGGRLLHLLELMGVWDAMVIVSRWYGGVQLGPDRFRIINQTARDALVQAGFGQDAAGKDGGKKKGEKGKK